LGDEPYFALNLAILGGSLGLLATQRPLAGGAFLCGVFTALLGASALAKGHEYYQRACDQKAAIERLIGLDRVAAPLGTSLDLTVSTTEGMRADREQAGVVRRGIRSGTIMSKIVWILRLIAAMDAAAMSYSWSVPIETTLAWLFRRVLS
jgi:hypothetical protein